MEQYLKTVDKSTTANIAKINYETGYGYYKLGDYTNAVMKL